MKKNTNVEEIRNAIHSISRFEGEIRDGISFHMDVHVLPGYFGNCNSRLDCIDNELKLLVVTNGESKTDSPTTIVVSIDDTALLERARKLFSDENINGGLRYVIRRVCFGKKHDNIPWTDTSEVLDRWEKYFRWLEKHYPKYTEKESSWDWNYKSSHLENYAAFAARVILGGVQPGEYTQQLIRDRKVAIGADGYVRLNDGRVAIFNFEHSEASDSVGYSEKMVTGGDFSTVFLGENSKIARCTKVPEQWELDEGVFIEFRKAPKAIFSK